jgi:C4-dicarboxylate-specific signal transduction histidine kinase
MSWRQAQIERAREQQRLAHLSRLGTMGELASGLAHEIN